MVRDSFFISLWNFLVRHGNKPVHSHEESSIMSGEEFAKKVLEDNDLMKIILKDKEPDHKFDVSMDFSKVIVMVGLSRN